MTSDDRKTGDERRPPTWHELRSVVHSGGGLWVTSRFHYAGIAIAWAASRAGMTPNMLTLLSWVLTTAGALLLVLNPHPGWPTAMASLVVIAFAYAMDCSDGQLARASGQGSKLGAWLDHTTDSWKIGMINACLGWVCIARVDESNVPLWLAYLTPQIHIIGLTAYFFGWNQKVVLAGKGRVGKDLEKSRWKRLLLLPMHLLDFGVFLGLWFLLPHPALFQWAYLILGIVTFPVYLSYLAISAWTLRRL